MGDGCAGMNKTYVLAALSILRQSMNTRTTKGVDTRNIEKEEKERKENGQEN